MEKAVRSVLPYFNDVAQDRLHIASLVISSLVTSLSSHLKETLHRDLEVAREKLEEMDKGLIVFT